MGEVNCWRKENRERARVHDKRYYTKHSEERNAKTQEYYAKNREAMKAKMKEWRTKNAEAIRVKRKAKWVANREADLVRQKLRYREDAAFREARRIYQKAWYAKNKGSYRASNFINIKAAQERYRAKPENRLRINARSRAYMNRRYKDDPNFQIMRRIRPRIRKMLRNQGSPKYYKTCELIGCTPEFLRGYLEGQFVSGMTWENIHIDHHIPCSAFDLREPEQQKQCFHYSNLKPLLAIDNLKKGCKIPNTK